MMLVSFSSSIGKKALMAVSGLVLLGFVVMHLLGNLLVFRGSDALNAYAVKLRHLGGLLWAARGLLLAAALIHIWTSIALSRENAKARPRAYRVKEPLLTNYAAQTMLLSGVLTLAYIIYHLLHFTFGVTYPTLFDKTDPSGRHDVYSMVVLSFQHPLISWVYLAGVGLLCLHLSHGISSTCQTLGVNNERTIPVVAWIGRVVAALLFIGYASIPVSILLGLVR